MGHAGQAGHDGESGQLGRAMATSSALSAPQSHIPLCRRCLSHDGVGNRCKSNPCCIGSEHSSLRHFILHTISHTLFNVATIHSPRCQTPIPVKGFKSWLLASYPLAETSACTLS